MLEILCCGKCYTDIINPIKLNTKSAILQLFFCFYTFHRALIQLLAVCQRINRRVFTQNRTPCACYHNKRGGVTVKSDTFVTSRQAPEVVTQRLIHIRDGLKI